MDREGGGVQDRYVGDVGDFGKYGMLKALCSGDLSLGVVWYLYPDEEQNGDGGQVGYLNPAPGNVRRFRDCDPALYDALGEIVRDGERRVASVRQRGVLHKGTTFYEAPLSFRGMPAIGPAARRDRLGHREAWVRGALEATRDCDVVFADPDNGFEPKAIQRHHRRGPKYSYFDELAPYLARGQSLVVYHHLHFGASTKTQVRERLAQVGERLGETFALRYRPGAARAFFVVPSDGHRETLTERAQRLAQDPCWGKHFTLVEPGQ